jgi:hypothetical protein
MSAGSWWASKVRQFGRHLFAHVSEDERAGLAGWLTPPQLAMFDGMPVADRRHGLDVVGHLREAGVGDDHELLLAALFHDSGKGTRIRLWHRVAWSLGEWAGPWVHAAASRLPGGREAMATLREHAGRSAELAAAVGCTARTAALIRGAAGPADARAAKLLHEADEAS